MLPIADLRIIAVEQFGAGPWATSQLADLGAEVIKIEDPHVSGDVGRYVPPFQEGEDSLFFETFNHNKKSVSLDLRTEAGREAFEDLVAASDAVFSNLRGDQPRKLLLRYDDLAPLNPRIVCASLSGFGSTGPRAADGGYDHTIQGLAGWMSLTGGPDAPPTRSGLSMVDFAGGYVAALAILSGVWRARREDKGCDLDLSLFETALHLLTYMGTWTASAGWEPRRLSDSAHQSMVPFQTFRASDGWLVIACPKQSLWIKLCEALQLSELAADARFQDFKARYDHRTELVGLLNEALAARSVDEWLQILVTHGIPCSAVNDVAAALADPQAIARDVIARYDHPILGEVRQVSNPIRVDGVSPALRRAPFRGEHTEAVMTEICGYTSARVEELRRAAAFG